MKRTISGIVMILLALLVFIPGGYVTQFGTMAFSLLGLFEYYKAFGIEKKQVSWYGYLMVLVYFATLNLDIPRMTAAWLTLSFIGIFGIYVLRYDDYKLEEILGAFTGIIYIGFLLSHVYLLRVKDFGLIYMVLGLVAACGCDTFAFLVGSKIGKHKMAPTLSPKKSIEGSIGGVIGATILGLVVTLGIKYFNPAFTFPTWACTLMVFVCSIVAEIGDLVASAVKRQKGIKDFGKLIPGHGGLLDRIDSCILVMPVMYYLLIALSSVLQP